MTDAHGIARDQLRAFIERIERLEEEKKTIADDIKDVYGEAKSMGYDSFIMKRVIALRKKDDQKRMEEDLVLATYLGALGMLPDFEPETPSAPAETRGSGSAAPLQMRPETVSELPEPANQSPRKAAEAVSERTAFTDATVAPALVEADKAEAVAGVLGQPETIPALTVQHDGVNVSGPERADVTAGETATISPEEAEEMSRYTTRGNGIAPASQGEAEAPSVESVSPQADEATTGRSDANTGGSHVGVQHYAATYQAGPDLVRNARPATPGAVTTEIDPPFPMKRAPFAHCFPELTKAQYDDLFAAIDAAGKIEEPIIRKGDVILDGWARYNIARSLGESYPVLEYDGDDELLDVIRWQRSSRDWTTQQEAKIAKDLAKEFPNRSEEIWAAFHIAELPDGEIVAA